VKRDGLLAIMVTAIATLGGGWHGLPAPAAAQGLVAAVLPSSRSVQVGTPATAFATVINSGAAEATGCTVAVGTIIPVSFAYYTTSAATNAITSGPNPAVTIGPGAAQSFLLVFTPAQQFGPVDVPLQFDCANTAPAPITSGLNTILLSAATVPVPDIVALAATLSNDGIVTLNSLGAFAVATVNVGAGETITASAVGATPSLPVSFTICRTDPATGQCLEPPTPTVTTPIGPNETHTFSVFVHGIAYVPFLPAVNRATLRFRDGFGITRGSTSVAVRSGSLAGSWRVTIRGTAVLDGASLPLVPATFEGAVGQHGNALSGTLLLDSVDDILVGLPPSCSLSCPGPGTCVVTCPELLSCTFTCTPATARCAEPLNLAGTADGVVAFGLQGSSVIEGSCAGAAGSGTLMVQDALAITLSGSPVTLTGTHAGRDDRACGGTGVFSGAVLCPSFSFSGTYDQAILTPAGFAAAAESAVAPGQPFGALWEVIARALERLVAP
jgi:hypothetical protein